jgi:hypothetical protein
MKLALSRLFYHLGDIVSITLLPLGVGWNLYQKLMLISVDLDTEFNVWKNVKPKKKRKAKKK